MRRVANRRLSGPLLVPSPKLSGWSLSESVPSANRSTSVTVVKVSMGVPSSDPQARRIAFHAASWESSNPTNTGAAGIQLLRPSHTPQTGSCSGRPRARAGTVALQDDAEPSIQQVLPARDNGVIVHCSVCAARVEHGVEILKRRTGDSASEACDPRGTVTLVIFIRQGPAASAAPRASLWPNPSRRK